MCTTEGLAHEGPVAADAAGAASAACAAGAAVPATAAEALAVVRAGLKFLATTDPAELTGAEQAELLRGLAAAESQHLAARSAVLTAFDRGGGYADDAAATARSWLRWRTRTTHAAAGACTLWARRLAAHSLVAAALAAGSISASWARHIIDWSDQLPEDARDEADRILLKAAAGGAELSDLATLAERIRARCAPPDTDGDGDGGFGERRLSLTTHFRGNARLDGDLTPDAAAAVQAVLDALGGRAGPEDVRSKPQRDHDALAEACRRLIAAGGLPDRAGQPTQIQLHLTLSQLLGQTEADEAAAAWIAANGVPAPPGADCDAQLSPIVTGTVDPGVLDQLATLLTGQGGSRGRQMTFRAARQLAIAHAARLLSGPGGLASWLRTSQLDGYAASVSLPLDISTTSDTIPVHLRRAVIRRDAHCRFPGCEQPPVACQVHHVVPRAEGGPTNLVNCCLLCVFHHQVAIHRWGWRLVLNPDGTTTATSPDGQRTFHSHSPPRAA